VATILGTYCATFDMRPFKLSSNLEGGAMNYFKIPKSTLVVDLISKQLPRTANHSTLVMSQVQTLTSKGGSTRHTNLTRSASNDTDQWRPHLFYKWKVVFEKHYIFVARTNKLHIHGCSESEAATILKG
jgi:hypothetical protein